MGGRQSSSPAADGRTRAYSGSDIPSSTGRGPIRGPAGVAASTSSPLTRYPYMHGGHSGAAAGSGAAGSEHTPPPLGSRSRSVGGIRSQAQLNQAGLSIPGAARDSGSSTPEEGGRERAPGGGGGSRLLIGSLPSHLSPHLFGEDVLGKDAGECTICLEDLQQGDTIARLPCLCIYHKGCIDEWFEVNRSCPEHPSD
ncbi:hypothetical protein GDO81_012175 [Engystomops pustulosus]|uniref:E3 ubiquitin-protein ligase ZNRF1 n=1 Tax=Engystomops pustulosus TaxID=76066 RepID=A0AAV7BK03_ENGPU|nr:hypothetical protein GDO81_012175 [Engystomops pustulosus]